MPLYADKTIIKYYLCSIEKDTLVSGYKPYFGKDNKYMKKTGCGWVVLGKLIDPVDKKLKYIIKVKMYEIDLPKLNLVADEITKLKASKYPMKGKGFK